MTLPTLFRSGSAGTHTRSFELDDIRIRSGGDGRTVEAYAAVFNTDAEIHDQDGHYLERIDPTAFNRTLSHRGNNFRVFYNHGLTLHGTPSERYSMPLGSPVEVRADNVGLLTVTRYNATPLADEVLEAIRSGDVRGQSFTGRILRSNPERGPHRARGGNLTTVTRHEIELLEYGPTPFPAYETAAVLGVRASTLAQTDAMLLQLILQNLAEGDAALDPIVSALCATDAALDQALAVISQVLATANPDEPEPTGVDRSAYLTRLQALATRLDVVSASRKDEADPADGGHSTSPLPARLVRARLYRKGLL